MTDAELQGIAAQALNMAKRDIEAGKFNFLLGLYYHEGEVSHLHRATKVEATIIQVLGEDWLNDGAAKDAGFGVIRQCVEHMPPEAFVMVTRCNKFTPTEKFCKLPAAKQEALIGAGADRQHRAVKEGLMAISDVLWAIAQTPERVCMYIQKVNGRGEFNGPPEANFMPQENYDGRTKMFGKGMYR